MSLENWLSEFEIEAYKHQWTARFEPEVVRILGQAFSWHESPEIHSTLTTENERDKINIV